MDPSNPYAPPTNDFAVAEASLGVGEPVLATRGIRLAGRILDNVSVLLPGLGALGLSYLKNPDGDLESAILLAASLAFVVIVFQAVLITRRGQSLGKLATKTRIELADGALPGFTRGVLLREVPFIVVRFVPMIGTIFDLADAVAIFGRDQRCLHDLLAGTRVVSLSPPRSSR